MMPPKEPKTETSKRIIPVSKDFLNYLETILRKANMLLQERAITQKHLTPIQ